MRTVQRRSPLTGVLTALELDVTVEELVAWRGGELAQNAMPRLTVDEREFVMTGYTKEDWEAMYGSDDDAD